MNETPMPFAEKARRESRVESDLRKTVRFSIAEGIFAQMFASLAGPGSIFLTKFAVLLQATPLQFGLMSAIGQLSQLFQPLGAVFTRHLTSRKHIVIILSAIGRSLALVWALSAILFPPHYAIWFFLGAFLLSASLQAISGNAWIAWVSDSVPLRIRGRFFSWRTQYLLFAGLVIGLLAGSFLDLFKHEPGLLRSFLSDHGAFNAIFQEHHLLSVFVGVNALAVFLGIIGLRILALQPEKPKPIELIPWRDLITIPLRDPNFRRLAIYGFWWMFVVGIGSPFWQPFMLRNLDMSLVEIQIYGLIAALASLSVIRYWGYLIDRFGNKAVMRICILLGGLNPLVWLFISRDSFSILYLEAATSGIMWGGAGIVATNFVLAIAPESQKQIYSGVWGAVNGIAMMMTMVLSGLFLPPPLKTAFIELESEQILFGLTGILRWTTLIPLSWIVERNSPPFGTATIFILNFAKVRIIHLADWVLKRNDRV